MKVSERFRVLGVRARVFLGFGLWEAYGAWLLVVSGICGLWFEGFWGVGLRDSRV